VNTFCVEISQVALNHLIGERVFDFPKKPRCAVASSAEEAFAKIDDNKKVIDKIVKTIRPPQRKKETEMDQETENGHQHETHDYTFLSERLKKSPRVAKDGKALEPSEQEKETNAPANVSM